MERKELEALIKSDLEAIGKKFTEKNQRYGESKDGLFNFTAGAALIFGEVTPDTQYRALFAYASKHLVTLSREDALTADPEFAERCLDVVVYMLIARAMHKIHLEEKAYLLAL